MTWALHEILTLAVIGLAAGGAGGLLGVGGSVVMIPAMTEVLGPDQHLYQAAAMIVNFFVVVPAVMQHHKARAIDMGTVARLLPFAAVTVVVGVLISELPVFSGAGEARLRGTFGAFLLIVVGSDLYRLQRRSSLAPDKGHAHGRARRSIPTLTWGRAAMVALPTGLIAGLLGVGGGLVAVPLQRRLLGIPIRVAIANSATVIIATSLVGASAKNYAYLTAHEGGVESFAIAAILIPTAILGSVVGSRLTHRAPLKVVKTAFFLLLFVAALRLIYGALSGQ